MSEQIAAKLDEARALIEKGWTQQAIARGRSGRPVNPDGRSAVCWCAVGAIEAVEPIVWRQTDIIRQLDHIIGRDLWVVEWNDAPERTQAEVIEAFRKAAELARAS